MIENGQQPSSGFFKCVVMCIMSSSLILTAAAVPKSLDGTVEGHQHFPLYLAHIGISV